MPGAYFITIVTKDRKRFLSEIIKNESVLTPEGEIVRNCWLNLAEKYPDILLDESIVMPNHFHGIFTISPVKNTGAINEPLPSDISRRRKMLLSKVVGYFKMNTSKQINILRNNSGNPVWQRNYFDRIIRNEKELGNVRNYIFNNPAKWEMDYENSSANYSNVVLIDYYNNTFNKDLGDS